MSQQDLEFLERAVALSKVSVEKGNAGPFGCVIVKDGKIVGEGHNQVVSTNDPTAHGEVVAIRDACKNLGTFSLEGCDVYTSCEPCPMCFGAIGWSRAKRVFYANTKEDASNIGFSDLFLYEEIAKPIASRELEFHHIPLPSALEVFQKWTENTEKQHY